MPASKPSYRCHIANLRVLGLGRSFSAAVWGSDKGKLWAGNWTCEALATRGICNRTTISRCLKILLAHGLAEPVSQQPGTYLFTEVFYRLPFPKHPFPLSPGPDEP